MRGGSTQYVRKTLTPRQLRINRLESEVQRLRQNNYVVIEQFFLSLNYGQVWQRDYANLAAPTKGPMLLAPHQHQLSPGSYLNWERLYGVAAG